MMYQQAARLFLSTLSLRRATVNGGGLLSSFGISIHALLAESDLLRCLTFPLFPLFLSTLSLRRATCGCCARCLCWVYFYPRSPCGERLHYDNYNLHCVEISIHALLAESDILAVQLGCRSFPFLSTLSLRRATQVQSLKVASLCISIHALLAESDLGRVEVV